MGAKIPPLTPAEVFARRVKEVRRSRGWTQRQLAERLAELDYPDAEHPMDRTAILRIERGKRADIRLSDVFAFALALDVWPLDLIIPREDEAPVAVTPARVVRAPKARAWIRGQALLRGMNPAAAFSQLPESEQRALMEAMLSRGMSPIARALTAEDRAAVVEEAMNALRAEEEEDDG